VWGAPTAHEDDAERSVRAALDLVDEVRSLGPGVSARAGVLTGEAAVTLGATGEGMVAGDLVNTASRLQSVAAAGTVLVGQSTQRAASAAIAFEPAGEQVLKGKTAPVPAFRALRVVAERGGIGRAEGLEAPFVGRDEELRLLKDLFHATGREKRTRLVSMLGQAGVGKSRLLWELSKYLDGVAETIYYHEGRSPAYGEGITFWALGEMVRSRALVSETDDPATTRQKVAATVAEWVTDEVERGWILESLLGLLGLEEPRGSREQLFAAWRTFFERIAQQGPVLLVFKDLQWADDGLLDFIDHILEWSRGVPIFIVTLARPELLERRPDWGAGRRNFVALSMEPLPEPPMRQLLAGLVPGLPDVAVRSIVERAAGIPLYAIETVRMLVAEGKVEEREGTYRPSADLAQIAVPESLHALIAARLDSLEPADRSLLQDAAVLGLTFTTGALSEVSGIDLQTLEARLRPLVRREILTLEANPRSPERGQWGFVQGLIREVAYGTLAKKDRRARHLAAARYFESLEDEEIAGALAGHYLAAYRASPEGPEAAALAAQARISLRAAAERAARLGAHSQAVAFYQEALTVTTDPQEEAEILVRAGEIAGFGVRHEVAEPLLERAIARYREMGDRAGILRAVAALGGAYLAAFRLDKAAPLLEDAQKEFTDLAGDPAFVALQAQLARTYLLGEDNQRAVALADQALEAAEHLDLVPIVVDVLVTKGGALSVGSRLYEGLTLLEGAERLARAQNLIPAQLRARANITAYLTVRDPRASVETAREGIEIARRYGLRTPTVIMATNGIESAIRSGEWEWAAAELQELLAMDLDAFRESAALSLWVTLRALRGEEFDDEVARVKALVSDESGIAVYAIADSMDGWIATARGDGAASYRAWMKVADESPLNEPPAVMLAGRAALEAREPAAARATLDRLDRVGTHGAMLDADRRTILAGLAAAEGRPTEALAEYRDALRRWRELGLDFDLARCGLEFLTSLPDEPEAREAAEESRRIFERLGARPFIERVDAALATAGAPASKGRRSGGRAAAPSRETETTSA
jgi:tetratricopeptide (TPR) repeat protein